MRLSLLAGGLLGLASVLASHRSSSEVATAWCRAGARWRATAPICRRFSGLLVPRVLLSAGQTFDVEVRLDPVAAAAGAYALRFRTTFYAAPVRPPEVTILPIVTPRY